MKKAFIAASCFELAMGILDMCKYEIPMKRIILWIFFFFYLLTALRNQYTKMEKGIFAISLILGGIMYVKTGINTGIKAPVYMFALKEMDIRSLFKSFLITMVIMIVAIFSLSLLGVFGSVYFYDVRKDRGFNGLRFCFGFSNPNMLQIALYGVLTYVFLLYGKNIKIIHWIAIMAIYLGITYMTNSQTGFLVGIFIGIAVLVVSRMNWCNLSNLLMILFVGTLMAMLGISFLAAADVEKGYWLECINTFISGRMNQLHLYTNDEIYALPFIDNWHLFSSRSNKNFYDMGYVQIFYYYGTVMATLYLLFVVRAVEQARRRKDSIGILLIFGLCIYLFMEARYFSNYLTRDFLLMVSAAVMWGKYEKTVSESV